MSPGLACMSLKSLQSCSTLWDPVDCSPPSSSVQRILQARILVWVTISSSRGSSQPRDQTHISCIGRWVLYHWATREALTTDTGIENILHLEYDDTGVKHNIDRNSGLESLERGRETRKAAVIATTHSAVRLNQGMDLFHRPGKIISQKGQFCLPLNLKHEPHL